MRRLDEEVTNTLDSNKTFTHVDTIIKEIIENSLDAKATRIDVVIKDSGLTEIEIKDNGIGIEKDCFENLCKRFTSTKINSYEDLSSSLGTFGFRGEALSILSYISTLIIVTRTKNSDVGSISTYRNGKLISTKPTPCEVGTSVKVLNIFYNNSVRRTHYEKTKANEMELITDTVSKIAFHFAKISFSLCDGNYLNKILFTNGSDEVDKDEFDIRKKLCIKLFKQQISDDLFIFDNINSKSISSMNISSINDNFKFVCYYTKPSASLTKSKLILFVNNRLLKNSYIQKIFDSTYSKFLIKKGNYFAYLSITCPNEMIDVNVKADKSLIFFIHEDKIFEHFKNLLESQLEYEINSKNYYASEYEGYKTKTEDTIYNKNNEKKTTYAKDKVRVDNNTVSIERFISLNKIGSKSIKSECKKANQNNEILSTIYDSLFEKGNEDVTLKKIISNNFYVGYEANNSYILLQCETSLYIVNAQRLLNEYFIYLFTSPNVNGNFIEEIKIKNSEYSFNDILNFIYDNFPQKKELIEEMRNDDSVQSILNETVKRVSQDLIKFDENNCIVRINVINFFKNSSIPEGFVSYIPMLYFSIVENIFLEEKSNSTNQQQQNFNLNQMIGVIKVLAYYISNSYIEYINKQNEEFIRNFFRDVILFNLKKDPDFTFRKNLSPSAIFEKIIDTETLYTVFERC